VGLLLRTMNQPLNFQKLERNVASSVKIMMIDVFVWHEKTRFCTSDLSQI
jgi:hypothetical protein